MKLLGVVKDIQEEIKVRMICQEVLIMIQEEMGTKEVFVNYDFDAIYISCSNEEFKEKMSNCGFCKQDLEVPSFFHFKVGKEVRVTVICDEEGIETVKLNS
jgi:hypothetical protein